MMAEDRGEFVAIIAVRRDELTPLRENMALTYPEVSTKLGTLRPWRVALS